MIALNNLSELLTQKREKYSIDEDMEKQTFYKLPLGLKCVRVTLEKCRYLLKLNVYMLTCDAALLQVSTRQKNKRVLIKRHMPLNANKYSADTVLGVVLTNNVDRKTSEQEKLRTIRFHLHNVPRQVRLI